MARPELDFGPPEHTHTEGVRFRLHGPGWEEWFTTVAEAPSGALHDLTTGIQYDAQRRPIYNAAALIRFVLNVLQEQAAEWRADVDVPEGAEAITPEQAKARGLQVEANQPPEGAEGEPKLWVVTTDDVARFYALVNDKARPVPIDQLARCVKGLAEALANRPTPPPTA